MNLAFHSIVRSWLNRVIRQRILLVNSGVSRKNPSLMITNAEHLRKYLNYYTYNTDRKMARFFVMNQDRIASLLPGHGSPGFDRGQEEYNRHLTDSHLILNQHENLHLRTNQQRAQSYARNI